MFSKLHVQNIKVSLINKKKHTTKNHQKIILSVLQAMWKPAYDFLVTWAAQIGDSYRDVIQELHMGLDKMKNPITKRWKHLTGTLILVNCLEALRSSAFSPAQDDYAI